MDKKPKLYKFKDIEHRYQTLEPGGTYINLLSQVKLVILCVEV